MEKMRKENAMQRICDAIRGILAIRKLISAFIVSPPYPLIARATDVRWISGQHDNTVRPTRTAGANSPHPLHAVIASYAMYGIDFSARDDARAGRRCNGAPAVCRYKINVASLLSDIIPPI